MPKRSIICSEQRRRGEQTEPSGFKKRPPPFWPSAPASEASPVRKEFGGCPQLSFFGVSPSFESCSSDLHGPSSPVHPTPQTEYQSSPTSSESDNTSKTMNKSQLRWQKLVTQEPRLLLSLYSGVQHLLHDKVWPLSSASAAMSCSWGGDWSV